MSKRNGKATRRSVLGGLLGMVALGTGISGAPALAETDTMTLGWVKSTANLAAFIAPEVGQKFELEVRSENFNNAVDIMTALVNGQLDVGLLTPIHLLRAIDNNLGLVQVSGNTRGNTGIVIAAKHGLAENDWEGLKRLTQQKKLRIASSRGSVNEALAVMEFDLHGVNIDKDLDLVNIPNFGQHPQALRSGEFDMIVTLEPLVALVVAQGVGTVFSRPYSSPAGDLNTNYVVRKDFAAKNPKKVQKFVSTIVEAQRRLAGDQETNVKTGVRLTGLDAAIVERALSNNRYEVRNGLALMQKLSRLAAQRGFIGRDVSKDLPNWVDDTFLKGAGVTDTQ